MPHVLKGSLCFVALVVCVTFFDLRWLSVGNIKGGAAEYCAAGSQYVGPCQNEAQSFAGMTVIAKKRWSDECKVCLRSLTPILMDEIKCVLMEAFFPCKSNAEVSAKTCHAVLCDFGLARHRMQN